MPQEDMDMAWIITKYFLTAAVVVLVSEVAKRSDKLGGFVAALPMVTCVLITSGRSGLSPYRGHCAAIRRRGDRHARQAAGFRAAGPG
jgi:hypothetical protein